MRVIAPTPIHFALLGCGLISQRHAEQMRKYGVLKAVCDTDIDKAKQVAGDDPSINIYDSIDKLLEREKMLDVVAVCTPNGLHAQHSLKILKAGIHVLCEKPMALTSHDCGEMIKQAERFNKRLFIVKQNRFNPPIEALKKVIDDGLLGKICSVQLNCFWNRGVEYYSTSTWKGRKNLDGGILFTQFSHFIDLLYWLIGDVQSVYAFSKNFIHTEVIEFEDSGVAALKFVNGILGTINFTINSYDQNMEGSITILGENGTVKIGGQYLNTVDYQKIKGYELKNLPKGNQANDYGKYKGSMSNHNLVYENILDVLLNNGAVSTNCFEGLKSVEIIEKIYLSAYQNQQLWKA
jgi:predicted dehydrogenase